MNLFLASQEALAGSPEVIIVVNKQKSIPLSRRIYERGIREQRNAIFLPAYYPAARKREIRSRANHIHFIKSTISQNYTV